MMQGFYDWMFFLLSASPLLDYVPANFFVISLAGEGKKRL